MKGMVVTARGHVFSAATRAVALLKFVEVDADASCHCVELVRVLNLYGRRRGRPAPEMARRCSGSG